MDKNTREANELFAGLTADELLHLEQRDGIRFINAFRARTHVGLVHAKRAWDVLKVAVHGAAPSLAAWPTTGEG